MKRGRPSVPPEGLEKGSGAFFMATRIGGQQVNARKRLPAPFFDEGRPAPPAGLAHSPAPAYGSVQKILDSSQTPPFEKGGLGGLFRVC